MRILPPLLILVALAAAFQIGRKAKEAEVKATIERSHAHGKKYEEWKNGDTTYLGILPRGSLVCRFDTGASAALNAYGRSSGHDR